MKLSEKDKEFILPPVVIVIGIAWFMAIVIFITTGYNDWIPRFLITVGPITAIAIKLLKKDEK